jgi:hypothetical protein
VSGCTSTNTVRQFRQIRTKAIQNSRFSMSTERQRQRAADHDEQLQHASIVVGVGAKIHVDEFWRWSGCHPAHYAESGAIWWQRD